MKGRRHNDYIPPGLEKVFSMIYGYRLPGTSGFYGDENCMFIPLKGGWNLTLAIEGNDVKAQLSRKGELVGIVETFALDKYMRIQEWFSAVGL